MREVPTEIWMVIHKKTGKQASAPRYGDYRNYDTKLGAQRAMQQYHGYGKANFPYEVQPFSVAPKTVSP
jgi:hypothetical protein